MNQEKLKRAKEILANETKPTPKFWVNKYKKEAAKNWDLFYKRNTTKFFKACSIYYEMAFRPTFINTHISSFLG